MGMTRRSAVLGMAAALASGRRLGAQQSTAVPLGDAAPLSDLGMTLSETDHARGRDFLRSHLSVDLHCHPGRFFLRDLPFDTPTMHAFGAPFEDKAIGDLAAGQVSAALIAAVSDARLLEPTATGGLHAAHDFGPGEAFGDYAAQLKRLQALLKDPRLLSGLGPKQVREAQHAHRTAAIFGVEGGDFIESDLGRLHAAHAAGVRAITIVHYHINQIGDIQTEAPVHHGLSPLGKSIVREMNHAGLLVDVAHATMEVVRDVVATSDKPVLLSHSNLATATATHPRLISVEHARLVSEAGGIIGSWPSGFGLSTFADFIDAIARLVDAVGIDHVGIGTDMDANYKPVLRSYRDWDLIPAALFAKGMQERDVVKIMGANFMRVFGANAR
jgi:membrane dipeptidase